MPKTKPVTIKGRAYKSMTHAAVAFGVSTSTISALAKSGRLDDVGCYKHSNRPKPVKIRGESYSSMGEAARALGLKTSNVQQAIKRGTLEAVGTGARVSAGPEHVACKEVHIRGVTYPSRTIAAEVLGVSVNAISNAEKRGSLETVGLGMRGRRRGDL